MVEAPGIFLLSDSSALRSCQCSGNLCGVLIAVDAKAAKESLVTVCSTLGMKLDTRIVKKKMTARSGCTALHGTPWTQAFFETVRCLSEQEQERYCPSRSRNATVFSSRWNCCICSAPRYLNRTNLSPAQAAQYPTVCWKSRYTSRRICLISSPLRSSANSFPFPRPS